MRATKIVFIGAGSGSFGAAMIGDAALTPELKGSTLVLVDIDAERLEVMAAFARRLNEALGSGLRIEHTTDRTRALPGAEFVISAAGQKNMENWQLDYQITRRHGIKQVWGGQSGPTGLARVLREVPNALAVARDMERLCPSALLLNFTNPEGHICQAIHRYSSVRAVGLCHGVCLGLDAIGQITGIPPADLDGIVAGINHFGWFLDVRRKSTGEDVYPLLRAADATYDQAYSPLARQLFRLYGLYPYPDDPEIAESVPYGWEVCGLEGYDFDRAEARREKAWRWISRIAGGDLPVPTPDQVQSGDVRLLDDQLPLHKSRDFAFPMIVSILGNRHALIPAVNILNDGLISNVPDWAVVEVPAVAGADSVRGIKLGALPDGIAALINGHVHVQVLFVDAAVKGSRQLALQALLADHIVDSREAAEKALDELLQVHARYLPQFKGR